MSSISSRCSSTHCSGTIEAVPQTTARTPAASAAKVSVSQPLSSVGAAGLDQLGGGDGVAAGVLQAASTGSSRSCAAVSLTPEALGRL